MPSSLNLLVDVKGDMCRLGYILILSTLSKDKDIIPIPRFARKLSKKIREERFDWKKFPSDLSDTALLGGFKTRSGMIKKGAVIENIFEFASLLGFFSIKKRKLDVNGRVANKIFQDIINRENPLVLTKLEQIFLLKCILEKDGLAMVKILEYTVSKETFGRADFMNDYMDGGDNPQDAIYPKILEEKIKTMRASSKRTKLKKERKSALLYSSQRKKLQLKNKWNTSEQYSKYRHNANPRIEWLVDLGFIKKTKGATFTKTEIVDDVVKAIQNWISNNNSSFYDIILPIFYPNLSKLHDNARIFKEIIKTYNIIAKFGNYQTTIGNIVELTVMRCIQQDLLVESQTVRSCIMELRKRYPTKIMLNNDPHGNLEIIKINNLVL